MAGGGGARLWPKSRWSKPKQFLDIFGTGKSFIRLTYERFAKLVPTENFMVVTNVQYKDMVLEHIPELDESQVLCEPVGRNTAPCICYAAYSLRKRNPEAKMIVTPSDHMIMQEEEFREIISELLDFITDHNVLMTVGLTPEPSRNRIRLHSEIRQQQDKPRQVLHRETEPRTCADVRTVRRVFLELGHIHLEGQGHNIGRSEVPARTPCPLQFDRRRLRNDA